MSFMHPFTVSRSHSERRTVRIYEKGVEEYSTVRTELRKLCSQLPLAKFPEAPGPVEGLEFLPVKTPARLVQEFKSSVTGITYSWLSHFLRIWK